MRTTPCKEKEGRGRSELILELYSNLLLELWEIVSALIGESILAFLFNLAIRKLEGKYPFLESLKVTEEGLFMDGLKEESQSLAPIEIHRGFQSLMNHLSQLFSTLADGVINKELFPKIFPKVKEAERIISQK